MNRPIPTAFVGELDSFAFNNERRTLLVRVGVPYGEFDAVTRGLGVPPCAFEIDHPAHRRTVVLLACRVPRHPEDEAAAEAEAEVQRLTALFANGALGTELRPALHDQLVALFATVDKAWGLAPAPTPTEPFPARTEPL